MKRYKLVQDQRGDWGIVDTGDCHPSEKFASWGPDVGWFFSDIIKYAGRLNTNDEHREYLFWEEYNPRESSKISGKVESTGRED